jgi:hypothetical protein
MKLLILAAALGALAVPAFGQGIRIGPDGLTVDDSRRYEDRRVIERRIYRDRRYRRGGDCRITVIRRERRDGTIVERRVRRCD